MTYQWSESWTLCAEGAITGPSLYGEEQIEVVSKLEAEQKVQAAMASHPTPDGEERFTIRDNGKWGWLVRDEKVGRDLLTNSLDEQTARGLADELNARPTPAPVYADPPYPDDTPDGPASPVLGDEERERLRVAVQAAIWKLDEANSEDTAYGDDYEALVTEARQMLVSALGSESKLAQGEERDG